VNTVVRQISVDEELRQRERELAAVKNLLTRKAQASVPGLSSRIRRCRKESAGIVNE
jgi:hypothetical protein